MHKIENKSLKKEEMSYGGGTWYMDNTHEELKKKRTLRLARFQFVWIIRGLINYPKGN